MNDLSIRFKANEQIKSKKSWELYLADTLSTRLESEPTREREREGCGGENEREKQKEIATVETMVMAEEISYDGVINTLTHREPLDLHTSNFLPK